MNEDVSSDTNHLSRRRFMSYSLGAAGALSLGVPAQIQAAPAAQDERAAPGRGQADVRRSIDAAYRFLNSAMDAYQNGSTLRLIQSYADRQGLGSTAFTYDNALAIIAYLERREKDDLARAKILGDSLLFAQDNDPFKDGRLRQAYWVGPFEIPGLTANADYFVKPDGGVNLVGFPWFFTGSAVGDMAWAALALAQLFYRTRERRYLLGAVRLGEWIVTNAYSDEGLGGYTFGVAPDGTSQIPNKSTEHNIDVYGLFNNLLAPLTGDAVWTTRAQHALDFIKRMWNAEGGFFYTGSNDGTTINTNPDQLPEDPQSWSYLALLDRRYAGSLDWAKTNLATTDTPQSTQSSFSGNLRFSGVTFSSYSLRALTPASQYDPLPDPDAVWFEGTAQMAAALIARNLPAQQDILSFYGDNATATAYLDTIRLAQAALGNGQTVNGKPMPEDSGIVAASSVVNTGFGFSYSPNLHVGATSWYLIAAQGGNPYQRGSGKGGRY